MLTGPYIPQFQGNAKTWERFLYKASKGSCKASDFLQDADLAYMVALTGDLDAPNSLDLMEYADRLCDHVESIPKPRSFADLRTVVLNARWIVVRTPLTACPRDIDVAYRALRSRSASVSEQNLFHDALIRCYECWSGEWLWNTMQSETGLNYNSLNVVAAMMLLALTWKVT